MGKITSCLFTSWRLGLKTGLYYLRTQSAAEAIKFTVDTAALKEVDTNKARERALKKKYTPPTTTFTPPPSGVRPMYMKQPSITSPNGVPTPSSTPPSTTENKHHFPALDDAPLKAPVFKADVPEGDSPKNLMTEQPAAPPSEEQLPEPALSDKKQEEDKAEENEEREHDIYADAVLSCSIENREECLMCSG